jgi:tetraacyldisaccharide 4'-kinase
VVLSRSDLIQPPDRERIWQKVQRLAPQAIEAETIHAPLCLVNHQGTQTPIENLQGQPVAAFCGIGNPLGFRRTLDACGCRVAAFWTFGDHHRFSHEDVEDLAAKTAYLNISAILCTRKDLVKLAADTIGKAPLWAVDIAIDFLSGSDALQTALTRVFGR